MPFNQTEPVPDFTLHEFYESALRWFLKEKKKKTLPYRKTIHTGYILNVTMQEETYGTVKDVASADQVSMARFFYTALELYIEPKQ